METDLSSGARFVLDALKELQELGVNIEELLAKKRTGDLSPLTKLFPNRIWFGSESLLRTLFDLLRDRKYRLLDENESWENFKAIFLTGKEATPIRWFGTIVLLVCIMEKFRKTDDLDGIPIMAAADKDQKHVWMQDNFRKPNNEKFDLTVLRTSLGKGVKKEADMFDAILKIIEKQWAMEKVESDNSSTP